MNQPNFRGVLAVALALVTGATGACAAPSGSSEVEDGYQSYDEYVASLPRDEDGAYFVEDHVPVYDRSQLSHHYAMSFPDTALIQAQLPGTSTDARYTVSQAINLTYCVSDTFGANKALVRDTFAAAAQEWEDATRIATTDTPTVNFIYASNHDGTCNTGNTGVFFNISPWTHATIDLASFGPEYAGPEHRVRRSLRITTRAFPNSGARTFRGALRHEIGHILGFRHEHLVQQLQCTIPEDDIDWRQITPYDVPSVMHYRDVTAPTCGNRATTDYTLTTYDNAGVRCAYTLQARAAADTAADACRALTALSTVAATYAVDMQDNVYRMVRTTAADGYTTTTISRYVPPRTTSAQDWTQLWTQRIVTASATTGIFAGGTQLYRRTPAAIYRWVSSSSTWQQLTNAVGGAVSAGSSVVVGYESGDIFRLNTNGTIDRAISGQSTFASILSSGVAGRKLFPRNVGLFRLESNGDLFAWTTAGWSAARIGSGIKGVAETNGRRAFAVLTGAAGTVMALGSGGVWSTIGSGASAVWGGLEVPYASMIDNTATPANEALTIRRNPRSTTWQRYALSSTSIMMSLTRRLAVNTNGRIYGYATP